MTKDQQALSPLQLLRARMALLCNGAGGGTAGREAADGGAGGSNGGDRAAQHAAGTLPKPYRRRPSRRQLARAVLAVEQATGGRYRLVKPISRGAFGLVAQGVGPDGRELAFKLLKLGPNDDPRLIAREILHHMKLFHAHVVRFKEVFAAQPYLCIAMELVNGGDLLDLINEARGLSEDEARYIFQQLILAIDYCHRVGVMNRDIKPENTLLVRVPGRPPMVKLCDFGYAKSLEDSAPTTRAGTFAYVSPEVITNTARTAYDGMTADVWSCGVLLYVTLFCSFPFASSDTASASEMRRVLQRMSRGEFSFPGFKQVSEDCKHLIRCMLNPDAHQRYSIADVKAHPWFLKNLLPGTLDYNDKVLASPRKMPQSEEEVRRAIEQSMAASQASYSTGYDGLQSDDEDML